MPCHQVAGYIAFADIDGPWWSVRGDIQAAQVCQFVAASHGSNLKLADVVLDWRPPVEVELEWDDAIALIRARGT